MAYKNYCVVVVFIIFGLAIVQASGHGTELFETPLFDRNASFKALRGPLGDCPCEVSTIDYFNNVKIFPQLQILVSKDYFRFYKINLKKECPFWTDNTRCAMKYCVSIKTCSKDRVLGFASEPSEPQDTFPATKYTKVAQSECNYNFDHDPALDYLNMTISATSQFEIAKKKALDGAFENFCECDDKDAEYVDLSLNPERYTGIKGSSAQRIWRSIYEENCFRPKNNPYESFPFVLSSDLYNMCLEKRVFYRAISGLQTSINIHLCAKYLLTEKAEFVASPDGEWGPNLAEFQNRFDPARTFGEGPNWLKNLYFLYLLEMRALAKAGPYLEREEYYTGNPTEDEETRLAVKNMLSVINAFPNNFNESSMFNGGGISATNLKNECCARFRNISRIMDCIRCDKCKLWGKLQMQGLGTALKILFSRRWDSNEGDPEQGRLPLRHKSYERLQRAEIVALFNAFAKLSNSIRELENFRSMLSLSMKQNIFGNVQETMMDHDSSSKPKCSSTSGSTKLKVWS